MWFRRLLCRFGVVWLRYRVFLAWFGVVWWWFGVFWWRGGLECLNRPTRTHSRNMTSKMSL